MNIKKLKEYYEKLEMFDWMDNLLRSRMKHCTPEIKEIYEDVIEENKEIRKELKKQLKNKY